jgi:hypothetical protein
MEEPTGRTSQALCKSAAICAAKLQPIKLPFSPNPVNGAAFIVGALRFADVRSDQLGRRCEINSL